MSPIETKAERRDGVNVLHVEGYLSADAHEAMEAAYAQSCGEAESKIVFSFRDGDFINSAGIGILIGLVMDARDNGRRIRFSHPSAHFRKIFEIVGLTKYVDVFPSVEESVIGF